MFIPHENYMKSRCPLLEEHVESLREEDVINLTSTAFSYCESAALNNMALQVLIELRGVGVDTASAILSAYQPQYYPYMSDEALGVAIGKCHSNVGDFTMNRNKDSN